jgi:hypothetical protein
METLREWRVPILFSVVLTFLSCLTGCGGSGGAGTKPTPNPIPAINSLSPSSVTAGGPTQTLAINGTNFLASSTTTYDGVAHPATFVNSTQLTISLSASDLATGGAHGVIVTNPAPGGGSSNSANFTVNNAAPTIISLSPTSATAGSTSQTLAINGTNFVSSTTATYNGLIHPATFVSSTQLTISLSAGDLATAGTYPVVVTNPTPGGGPSNIANFLVTIISTLAYQTLTSRVTANQNGMFLYKDEDSGFNHGFPSGVFPSGAVLTIDAGCVDSPTDVTIGCYSSTDVTDFDISRGTVLRITFPALPGSAFAGLNIEEPQNWGVLVANNQCGVTVTCNGYNLTGATAAEFDVRSPTGINVQFGVGQCETQFLTLPASQTYTHISMALNTSSLGCTPSLNSVNVLFTVTASNAAAGATILLDNIRFTPAPARASQAQETLSLPLSTQTFGVVPQTSSFPSDQVNRNVAAIYESALTILALLNRAQPGDITNALEIANAFDYALYHDNRGDFISTTPGGAEGCYAGIVATQCGLHRAYESGDIALLNDQNGTSGTAKAGDSRLAGFTCGSTSPNGFCLDLDGATGGDNSWAILALLASYQQSGNTKYLNDAVTIANWIVTNLSDTTGSGFGGYYVGYPDAGAPPPKGLIQGKSVENNADIFAAFTALAAVESQLGNQITATSWSNDANVAGDFVMQMYDSATGRFNVGTLPANNLPAIDPTKGNCPDTTHTNGNDVLNSCDFLDAETFTTLALAGTSRYSGLIDWRKPIQYASNKFAQSVTVGSHTFQGFNLIVSPSGGASGIAWEFTAQAVETMRFVDKLYNQTTFESAATSYLGQIHQAQTSAPFGDGQGLVAATIPSGDVLPPVSQCMATPFQCMPERVGLAATVWSILAEQGINPIP